MKGVRLFLEHWNYTPSMGDILSFGEPEYLSSVGTGAKLFKLRNWFRFRDKNGVLWVVPKGFVCDLASIPPWMFWWQWGGWNTAAIAHDFAYNFGQLHIDDDGLLKSVSISKVLADKLFADICLSAGVKMETTRRMYLAVLLFGRGVWSHHESFSYGKPIYDLQSLYSKEALSCDK